MALRVYERQAALSPLAGPRPLGGGGARASRSRQDRPAGRVPHEPGGDVADWAEDHHGKRGDGNAARGLVGGRRRYLVELRQRLAAALASGRPGSPGRAARVRRAMGADAVTMDKIVALCKRRGFIFQSSEIYGGLASTYDYGHYGVLLKSNVKAEWWRVGAPGARRHGGPGRRDPHAPADLGGVGPPRGLHRPARPVPRQVQEALARGPPARGVSPRAS